MMSSEIQACDLIYKDNLNILKNKILAAPVTVQLACLVKKNMAGVPPSAVKAFLVHVLKSPKNQHVTYLSR